MSEVASSQLSDVSSQLSDVSNDEPGSHVAAALGVLNGTPLVAAPVALDAAVSAGPETAVQEPQSFERDEHKRAIGRPTPAALAAYDQLQRDAATALLADLAAQRAALPDLKGNPEALREHFDALHNLSAADVAALQGVLAKAAVTTPADTAPAKKRAAKAETA